MHQSMDALHEANNLVKETQSPLSAALQQARVNLKALGNCICFQVVMLHQPLDKSAKIVTNGVRKPILLTSSEPNFSEKC